jgi:predicted enzyme related to lactoylglutathione lyase
MKFLLLTMFLMGAALAQTPMRVTMISLGVRECARSIPFYRDVLGLEMIGKPGEVTMFRAGDVTIVLNEPSGKSAKGGLAGTVEVIFPVESVAAAHTDLKKRGATFLAGPHEVTEGLWAATLTDPDGHRMTVLGPR